jgi:predicted nucleic acid-binding protein
MSVPLLVADSGPLIALARLSLLYLPGCYFESLSVTSTVWDEVTRKPTSLENIQLHAGLAAGHIKIVDDVLIPLPSWPDMSIDVGEQTAIGLALALPATLLIDDRRGRNAAESMGVVTLGTMGLLVRARLDALVPPLRPQLEFLRDTGYFLSASLIDQVLSAVGE